jgi:hypothetical protein
MTLRPIGPPAPFVVGVPRSGTTLLRLLLDAHPDLAIPSETGFAFVLGALPPDASRDDLFDGLVGLHTWGDLGVSRDDLAAEFARLLPASAGEGLRAFYRLYAAQRGKSRWGDKTPVHVEYMDVLAEALPEARFVHIVRDGRGVAASWRGLAFAPGDGSIEAIATAWSTGVEAAQRMGAGLPHYREVRYEQLVDDPEATLRELCDFLELPFDGAMLRAHEHAPERLGEVASIKAAGGVHRLPDGDLRPFELTLHPPDAGRAEAWRNELTGDEVARFEAIAGSALAARGYAPAGRR